MKTILILRHGKSSWSNDELADHDRPLKKRGVRDASKIGSLIREKGITPEIIFSSSAKRAKDTAKIVADSCGYDGEIIIDRSLYHGYPGDFIELLYGLNVIENIIMIVGHNPGLEEFLSDLIDEYEWLPTAALAQVNMDIEHWSELDDYTQGKLVNLWRPRELSE